MKNSFEESDRDASFLRPPSVEEPFRIMQLPRKNLFDSSILRNEHFEVFLRLKPNPHKHGTHSILDENTLLTEMPKESVSYKVTAGANLKRKFYFTSILDESATQKQTFQKCVLPSLKKFLRKESCLVMAFGTTSAGKTFTMQGTTDLPGIIPRALSFIFRNLEGKIDQLDDWQPYRGNQFIKLDTTACYKEQNFKKRILNLDLYKYQKNISHITYRNYDEESFESVHFKEMESNIERDDESIIDDSGDKFSVWVSMIEIYNETLVDLLQFPNERVAGTNLSIGEDDQGGFFVKNARQVHVRNGHEAYQINQFGRTNLHRAPTALNDKSSRSHCIFTVTLGRRHDDGSLSQQRFTFADLAGSERVKKTQNDGQRLVESNSINKSLSVLGKCIQALKNNSTGRCQSVIPIRDSKMTKLFKNALLGTEKLTFIINVTTDPLLFDETQHVLKFSAIAQEVVPEFSSLGRPGLATMLSASSLPDLSVRCGPSSETVDRLKSQLSEAEQQIDYLQDLYADAQSRVEQLVEHYKKKDEELKEVRENMTNGAKMLLENKGKKYEERIERTTTEYEEKIERLKTIIQQLKRKLKSQVSQNPATNENVNDLLIENKILLNQNMELEEALVVQQDLEATVESLKKQLQEEVQTKELLEKQISQLEEGERSGCLREQVRENLEEQLEKEVENNKELKEKICKLEKQIQNNDLRKGEDETEVGDLKNELVKVVEEKMRLEEKIDQLQEDIKSIEDLRNQLEAERAANKDLKEKLAIEVEAKEKLLNQISQLEDQVKMSESLKEQLDAEIAAREDLTKQLEKHLNTKEMLEKQISNLQQDIENTKGLRKQLEEEVSAKEQLQIANADLEEQVIKKNSEQENFKLLHEASIEEIKNLNQQICSMKNAAKPDEVIKEIAAISIKELEKRLEEEKRRNKDLEEESDLLRKSVKASCSKQADYLTEVTALKAAIQALEQEASSRNDHDLQQLSDELQTLKDENEELKKLCEKITKQLKDLELEKTNEIKTIKMDLVVAEKKLEVAEYQSKVFHTMKEKADEKAEKIPELEEKIEQLVNELENKEKEFQAFENQRNFIVSQQESQIRQYQQEIEVLKKDINFGHTVVLENLRNSAKKEEVNRLQAELHTKNMKLLQLEKDLMERSPLRNRGNVMVPTGDLVMISPFYDHCKRYKRISRSQENIAPSPLQQMSFFSSAENLFKVSKTPLKSEPTSSPPPAAKSTKKPRTAKKRDPLDHPALSKGSRRCLSNNEDPAPKSVKKQLFSRSDFVELSDNDSDFVSPPSPVHQKRTLRPRKKTEGGSVR